MFRDEGVLYRRVEERYRKDYELLTGSGLHDELVDEGLLVACEEVPPASLPGHESAFRILRPEPIPFVSYPYEWSFSQLKDAALLTLDIQLRALERGMWLKDASAYNVQFVGARPVFIDTLSFEAWPEGAPWVAYQQFCRHFLAPLALMAHVHVGLRELLRVHIDGIPLDLASRLLPARSRLRFSLLTHIHMHAASLRRHQQTDPDAKSGSKLSGGAERGGVGKTALLGLIDNLRSAISRLEWRPKGTEWGDYYEATNYSGEAERHKGEIVGRMIETVAPASVWDLGANTGVFSRLASGRGIPTVAFDIDPAAVEKNYRAAREAGETKLLPLLMDLTNPSGDLGWDFRERDSLLARGPADLALALALIHHLAISNNVPLPLLAASLRQLCRSLVIEFVPKSDSQVQRLLASREDVFPGYTQEGFEAAFAEHFELVECHAVEDSERTLYRFR
jgi:ribosomal protein L11 methylase PrmA